jgi:hypothetical protein
MTRITQQTFNSSVEYAAGRDLHVHYAQRTWWDLGREDLLRVMTSEKRQIAQARKRALLNWNAAVCLALNVVVALILAAPALEIWVGMKLMPDPLAALLAFSIAGASFVFFVELLKRRQRPEWRVIQLAKRNLEEIQVVLRLRGWY